MKFKTFRAFIWTMAVALTVAASAWAHHSPSAIFDMTKKVNITGTLTKVDWTNPHIVVLVDVKKGDATEEWKFESNPPAWFRQVGVNRNDFAKALGQTVTVEVVTAIDGSRYGYIQKITLPGGEALELVGEPGRGGK